MKSFLLLALWSGQPFFQNWLKVTFWWIGPKIYLKKEKNLESKSSS